MISAVGDWLRRRRRPAAAPLAAADPKTVDLVAESERAAARGLAATKGLRAGGPPGLGERLDWKPDQGVFGDPDLQLPSGHAEHFCGRCGVKWSAGGDPVCWNCGTKVTA